MAALYRSGKIRAIGVSNFGPAEMDAFRAVAPLQTVQPPYNLFERGIENSVLPYSRDNNITTLVYGSLCRGLLSGRMDAEYKLCRRRSAPQRSQIPIAAVSPIHHCCRKARSLCAVELQQTCHSSGITLAARSTRCGSRTVGRATPRSTCTRGRCHGLAHRCQRDGRNRSHPENINRRPCWPRIHGAAGAQSGKWRKIGPNSANPAESQRLGARKIT